jgi:hypothetical protein
MPYNNNVKSPVGSGSRSVAFTNLPIKQAIQNNNLINVSDEAANAYQVGESGPSTGQQWI